MRCLPTGRRRVKPGSRVLILRGVFRGLAGRVVRVWQGGADVDVLDTWGPLAMPTPPQPFEAAELKSLEAF